MAFEKLVGADEASSAAYTSNELFILAKFTAVKSGSMTVFKVKAAYAGAAKINLYADNAGEPGSRIAYDNTGHSLSVGWNDISFLGAEVVLGTVYWLGICAEGYVVSNAISGSGVSRYKFATYSTFTAPDPAGTGFSSDTKIMMLAVWGGMPQIIYPSGIEQPIAVGTPLISKLQKLIFPTGIEQLVAVGTPTLTKVAPTLPDFPDWTMSVRLVGTEIFLPINVQGVSVTIPMDIKAVSIGTISVDITAQTVGDVTISLSAQTIAIKSQSEWSPQQGEQKYFQASAGGIAYSYGGQTYYTVPTGKTLYLTHLTFAIWAAAAADGDKDQIGYCHIRNHTDSTTLTAIGGHGGGGVPFPTALKVSAGKVLELKIINYANHAVNAWASCGGYEI
jgi:hypothetical protein